MKYLDIYVMISPARGDNYQVSAKSADGGEGNSELKLPFRLSELSPSIFGASTAARGMSVGDVPPERLLSVEMVGVQLFDALFSGETREVLRSAEDAAKRNPDKTGVRIRLSMNLAAEGMAEVASLPWELMRRRNQNPLVVSVNTPVVRAFDTPISVPLHPIIGKLKILLLVSNPKGTSPLNLGDEKARICKIWDALDNIEYVECRPEARLILDALSQDEFHVVHYMGHGNFDSGLGGQVIMESADGSEQPISGNTFATWLQDEPLRLVFLNACNTGMTGEQTGLHPFAGVASALIGSGVPSVVAMQFPISDEAAIIFAETFYKRIAQGLPVEQAMSEGRKGLLDRTGSEWATPVLYMRAANGDLFDRSSGKATAAPDQAAVVEPVIAAAPLPLLSVEPDAPAKPWYKKPAVLGGIAAAVLAIVILSKCVAGGTPSATPAPAEAAANDATNVSDPSNPASKAIADIDPSRWVNDPDCGIVTTVLNSASGNEIQALAGKGDAKASYLQGCIIKKGLNNFSASEAAAASWFEYAANAKVPEAMYLMGVYKDKGAVVVDTDEAGTKPVDVDEQMATTWYQNAKAAGNTEAAKALEQPPEQLPAEPQ
ncbi:MAG: CHAT domain-containing protein [Pseudomonadota bacterium]|nr:CHAT domain-containing protein [Pseudomonadota bacterium]